MTLCINLQLCFMLISTKQPVKHATCEQHQFIQCCHCYSIITKGCGLLCSLLPFSLQPRDEWSCSGSTWRSWSWLVTWTWTRLQSRWRVTQEPTSLTCAGQTVLHITVDLFHRSFTQFRVKSINVHRVWPQILPMKKKKCFLEKWKVIF